jgi:hypothetical protein
VRLTIGVDVAAPSESAWTELTDTTCWPLWGPTVRAAHLDDGGRYLHEESTGFVETALGVRLPFQVDGWRETGSRKSWSWRVAGVHATEHTVRETGPATCQVQMSVPWWAPAYLGVVALAMTRIRRRVEAAGRPGASR